MGGPCSNFKTEVCKAAGKSKPSHSLTRPDGKKAETEQHKIQIFPATTPREPFPNILCPAAKGLFERRGALIPLGKQAARPVPMKCCDLWTLAPSHQCSCKRTTCLRVWRLSHRPHTRAQCLAARARHTNLSVFAEISGLLCTHGCVSDSWSNDWQLVTEEVCGPAANFTRSTALLS